MPQKKPRERMFFGEYELDARTGELRHKGVTIKLQPQPAKILYILVSRAPEVVTRQELTEQVWGAETYVDFEHGLNYAVRQIRTALEDDADDPRFLETLPKRGYRFIGEVSESSVSPVVDSQISTPTVHSPASRSHAGRVALRYGIAALAIAAVGVAFVLLSGGIRRHSNVTASTDRIDAVAVLPLRNLSSDPEQEYFSDGITDELITELAKVRSLHVISHTSVERYKETKRPLREVARELGVDAIVEGTVTRSGDRIRITAQLIDARTDQHLWAESYERDFRDILSLQGEVAQQIARQVGINLTPGERARLGSTPVVDQAAHEAYLKGLFYWNQLTCEGSRKGLEYFQQAVDKDPSFAEAQVGVAQAYFMLGDWGCLSLDVAFPRSKSAALKAIELNPSLGRAHEWLG